MSELSSDREDSASDDSAQNNRKRRKLSSDDDFEPSGPSTSTTKKPPAKKPPAKKPVKKEPIKKEPKEKKPKKPAAVKPKKEPATKKPATKKPAIKNFDGDAGPPEAKVVVKSAGFPGMQWNVAEYLAELQDVQVPVAANLVHLLKEDNTIPFIARYRKEMVGGLGPEKLRDLKETFEMLERVAAKAKTVRDSIQKQDKLTSDIEMIVCHARSVEELDYIYLPFKPGAKGTLANRARQLGLEDFSMELLTSGRLPHPVSHLVNPELEGLLTETQVLTGVQHIIADVISKDKAVLDQLRELKTSAKISLVVSKAKKSAVKVESKPGKAPGKSGKLGVENGQDKQFELYFNFSTDVKWVKPHQVLAINRGENLKVLSVKIAVDDWARDRVRVTCLRRWGQSTAHDKQCADIVESSISDAYQRLLQPLLARQIRADLNQKATHASIEVFATNLKDLLLAPPTRGLVILGLDPGFRNGCKLGVIAANGQPLHTDVIYPNFGRIANPTSEPAARKLKDILVTYQCELIALGNGSACRETETFLSDLITRGWFAPLDVRYTIVSEQGVSIYSCSPLATQEFPGTAPNVISAVSLARRIQDPLSELVKVEPQHLGVGMYQHDIAQKELAASLTQVVEECVSFVGVDLNAASDTILKFIAGLNATKVNKILEWRATHGPFVNREQLKLVAGIGEKCFQQCAGFVRIMPETIGKQEAPADPDAGEKRGKKRKREPSAPQPLDRTWIHPESYGAAAAFMARCGVDAQHIGSPAFIQRIRDTVQQTGLAVLAVELGVGEAAMKLMSDGLQQLPGQDLRSASSKPLFRSATTSIDDLKPGQILTGRAENVTHFGVFVDVGVGKAGLLHSSKIPRGVQLHLGDRLEVRVLEVKPAEKKVSLALVRVL